MGKRLQNIHRQFSRIPLHHNEILPWDNAELIFRFLFHSYLWEYYNWLNRIPGVSERKPNKHLWIRFWRKQISILIEQFLLNLSTHSFWIGDLCIILFNLIEYCWISIPHITKTLANRYITNHDPVKIIELWIIQCHNALFHILYLPICASL